MSNHSLQKNWFQKHRKWLIPLLFIGVMIPVFTTPIGTALKDYGSLYTNPEVYEDALELVKKHDKASQFLGKPIEILLLFEGEVQYSDNGNSVNMTIPIKGSKVKARMDIKAKKVKEAWTYQLIQIRTKKPTQKTIIITETTS